MSGRLLRLAGTACGAAALAAQAVLSPGLALAAPKPPEPGERTVATPQPPGPGEPPAAAPQSSPPGEPSASTAKDPDEAKDPDGRSVGELLTDLSRLYREAEQATEAYNATEERLKQRRAKTRRLDAELATARLSLHDSRGAAGRLAREQYQGGTGAGVSSYVRLLLARDPQHALDQGHVIGRLARSRAETVGRLASGERRADGLARAARAALDDQLTLTERSRQERDDVDRRLDDVEELLASLTADRLAALAEWEKKGVAQAQEELMASGAIGEDGKPRRPSKEGGRAVRYALRQLGKPYEWGAEGPRTYDCSGLTSRAWGHAGTPIPRTSQEQWARLPRVPLGELRPGDLVIYFPEATHVAMYLGKGEVVQAPRTGEKIKISPIASFPLLGAVRPDRERKPLPRPARPKTMGAVTTGAATAGAATAVSAGRAPSDLAGSPGVRRPGATALATPAPRPRGPGAQEARRAAQ